MSRVHEIATSDAMKKFEERMQRSLQLEKMKEPNPIGSVVPKIGELRGTVGKDPSRAGAVESAIPNLQAQLGALSKKDHPCASVPELDTMPVKEMMDVMSVLMDALGQKLQKEPEKTRNDIQKAGPEVLQLFNKVNEHLGTVFEKDRKDPEKKAKKSFWKKKKTGK
ncbi:unnamed protein product [Caenorhabditis sp. 36 PRJEB53466]|nr:unnamed protein product [Caenorhabditis sp. 36 PRJEB53466]